jgi:pimeloyl-ACP methyl ester carboxylesterase
MSRPGVLAGLAGTAASAGAWWAVHAADRRRVARDPAWDLLADPPEGQRVPIRAADGTGLHCTVAGRDSAPTVVLVHGWTCKREFWAPQLNALQHDLRLVSYDLRGHGKSDGPAEGDFSVESLADDLAHVLQATLRDGERTVLVGHSLGAMTIVAFGHRHPELLRERVASVVLLSTGVRDLITESLVLRAPSGLSAPFAAVSRRVVGAELPYGRPNPVTHRAVRYVALSPWASPAAVAFCERIVLDCDRKMRAGFARTLSSLDLEHGLEHLHVPATVLVGAADRLTPPKQTHRLAQRLPHAVEVAEVPRVGHMLPVEAPEEVNKRVLSHVDDYLGGR